MTFRLGYYEPGQLGTIVRRSAGILAVEIDDDAADEIAGRSRGTPRIANRILRRVRDVAEVRHAGKITNDVAREALELLEVDGRGLERIDRELLSAVADKFGGGPVGLSTLAVALGEETDTIEDVYEPYLLQLGFLQRTPRGRMITELGRQARRRRPGRREPVLAMPELWTPGMSGPLESSSAASSAGSRAFAPSTGSSGRVSASSSPTARSTASPRSRPSPASGS